MATPRNPYNDTPGKSKYQGSRDTIDAKNPPEQSESSFLGNTYNNTLGIGKKFISEIATAAGFAKQARGVNLPLPGTERQGGEGTASWSNSISNPDWRVKISLPVQFPRTGLLAPLAESNALVFPYTPTIIVSHSANYNSLQPVHTNYPFQIYDNSSVQEIVITGDFTVENDDDGRYWIAAIHYLRSVTKMFYGNGANAGSPPPLVKLNGYGDYVFNSVPCVVTNFTVDLPADVDYIAVPMPVDAPGLDGLTRSDSGKGIAWVPSSSLITVTVQPTYSRKEVSKFSLNDFVNGNYVTNGKGFV